MKPEKAELKTKSISEEQKNKLKSLFPEVFSEDKIDFDKLKLTLGAEIEIDKEHYNFTWKGKSNCFKIIQDQSIATLKPEKKESVEFDKTQNLFIEGDNLEVLKLLQKSYYGKIKMIYIDPPYNTGHDFVYKDNFGQQIEEYLKLTKQVDGDGKKLSTNAESEGRYHSNWLNMMYPRLFLAKNLLKEDGVIFISIDDNELNNLKNICNEIFGEENIVGDFIRRTRSGGGFGTSDIGIEHDYIICYAKDRSKFSLNKLNKDDNELKKYFNKKDELGVYHSRELRQSDNQAGRREDRPFMFYCFTFNNGKLGIIDKKEFYQLYKNSKFDDIFIKELEKKYHNLIWPIRKDGKYGRWTYGYDSAFDLLNKNNLECINGKIFNKERMNSDRENKVITTILNENDFTNTIASIELKQLINNGFDFPKPIKLLKLLSNISTNSESADIVLDFFAGSGTTAHAVLDLNKEDGGNRKFILVQLPELTNEDSEAYKAGYKNIAEIAKERIRRVIKKIKEEDKEKAKDMDLGFKVFKLAKSNFKIWDTQTKDVQTALTEHVDQIKKDAPTEAILYELLLKDGLELTTNITEKTIAGKKVYSIEKDTMFICLEKELKLELFKELSKIKPHRVIVLDEAFKDNDSLKTNAVQTLGKNNDKEYVLRTI
jgi:adenine-specific DNA-methyltransferase